MEYNELIAKVQHLPVDVPDSNAILQGVRHKVTRRRRQRQVVASMLVVLVLGGASMLFLPQPTPARPLTLAERVSRTIDTPRNDVPAPLAGYRHSIYNRQIYTLL